MDVAIEMTMSRANDPPIDLLGPVCADRTNLFHLYRPQEFDLLSLREFSHLIQKQGPPFASRKAPFRADVALVNAPVL